jgi:hypothetical protein
MFRKILLACSIAFPLGLIGTMPASADTDFEVHFGVPFYAYQVSPRYRYYEDYGWYDAYAYPRFRRSYHVYDDDDYVIDDDDYDYDDDGDYIVISPER